MFIAGNIVTQSGGAANTIQSVPQQQSNQNVSSSGGSGTYVATIATVLPPRHQTATLVYSNPQQIGSNIGGPRLAVANSIANQRQGKTATFFELMRSYAIEYMCHFQQFGQFK